MKVVNLCLAGVFCLAAVGAAADTQNQSVAKAPLPVIATIMLSAPQTVKSEFDAVKEGIANAAQFAERTLEQAAADTTAAFSAKPSRAEVANAAAAAVTNSDLVTKREALTPAGAMVAPQAAPSADSSSGIVVASAPLHLRARPAHAALVAEGRPALKGAAVLNTASLHSDMARTMQRLGDADSKKAGHASWVAAGALAARGGSMWAPAPAPEYGDVHTLKNREEQVAQDFASQRFEEDVHLSDTFAAMEDQDIRVERQLRKSKVLNLIDFNLKMH